MFDGTTFRSKEFEAWINSEPKGAELTLKCKDANLARNRILKYAQRGGHTIETTKETDTRLTIKLIWI